VLEFIGGDMYISQQLVS